MRQLSSPSRVLIARKAEGKLTDAEGSDLHICPHRLLKRYSPGPFPKELADWLKQPGQHELVRTLIASAAFVVSTREEPWRLLTSFVPWHFVWHLSGDNPVHLLLALYDDLSPEQEQHIIKAGFLGRGLTDGDPRRSLIQSPAVWRQFGGLSQERFATLLDIAPATINYHVKRAESKEHPSNGSNQKRPKTPARSQPQTNATQHDVKNELTQLDREHPTKLAVPPASSDQPSDSPIFNDHTTNGIGPDAKSESGASIAASNPSAAAVGDPKTVIGGESERRLEISAPSDGKPDCVEPTTPFTPKGKGENGLSKHDALLRAGVGTDHQVISLEQAGGDPQPNEVGVPDVNVKSPIESMVQSDRDSDVEPPSSRNGEDTNPIVETLGNAPTVVQESSGPSQLILTSIESQLPAKIDTLRPPLSRGLKQRQAGGGPRTTKRVTTSVRM